MCFADSGVANGGTKARWKFFFSSKSSDIVDGVADEVVKGWRYV